MYGQTSEFHHLQRPKKRVRLPTSFLATPASRFFHLSSEKKFYVFLSCVAIVGIFINLFLFFNNLKLREQPFGQSGGPSTDASSITRVVTIESVKERGRVFAVRLDDGNLVTIVLTGNTTIRTEGFEGNESGEVSFMSLINIGPGVKVKISFAKSDFSLDREFPVSEFVVHAT